MYSLDTPLTFVRGEYGCLFGFGVASARLAPSVRGCAERRALTEEMRSILKAVYWGGDTC